MLRRGPDSRYFWYAILVMFLPRFTNRFVCWFLINHYVDWRARPEEEIKIYGTLVRYLWTSTRYGHYNRFGSVNSHVVLSGQYSMLTIIRTLNAVYTDKESAINELNYAHTAYKTITTTVVFPVYNNCPVNFFIVYELSCTMYNYIDVIITH